MKITFIGATHEVTGSCYYLEAAGRKFLVDYGMEQGPDYYENKELPVAPGDLDFVLLTHAHMDHSGNLPALYAKGYQGPIYATEAPCNLCDIMLRDSAHIQMFEAEWRNRKGRREGKPEFIPAYTMEDAMGVLRNFVRCPYDKIIKPAEGIEVRFVDAGHLLGSSSIEIWLTEDDKKEKIVFSGDIGNLNQPLIKDPVYIKEADYVVMESTYGDRSHGERPDYPVMLAEIIQKTFDRGGNLVIPSFAVGRTQEMLYFIRQIKEQGLVHGHDGFTVYVDSPLAGRIKHHLKHNLWDPRNTILFVGYQAIGTPGRALLEGATEMKLFGETVQVAAEISRMPGISGHADVNGLLNWARAFETKPKHVFVTHGDDTVTEVFAQRLKEELGYDATAPFSGTEYDLLENKCIHEAVGIRIVKATASPKTTKAARAYEKLLAMGRRLMTIIRKNEGCPNKDLDRFARDIQSLCDKWYRTDI